MQYLFGDSDIAARRLEVLAEVFAEPTRAFFLEAVPKRPRLAVDLGCGPGYTTHLLRDHPAQRSGSHSAARDLTSEDISIIGIH